MGSDKKGLVPLEEFIGTGESNSYVTSNLGVYYGLAEDDRFTENKRVTTRSTKELFMPSFHAGGTGNDYYQFNGNLSNNVVLEFENGGDSDSIFIGNYDIFWNVGNQHLWATSNDSKREVLVINAFADTPSVEYYLDGGLDPLTPDDLKEKIDIYNKATGGKVIDYSILFSVGKLIKDAGLEWDDEFDFGLSLISSHFTEDQFNNYVNQIKDKAFSLDSHRKHPEISISIENSTIREDSSEAIKILFTRHGEPSNPDRDLEISYKLTGTALFAVDYKIDKKINPSAEHNYIKMSPSESSKTLYFLPIHDTKNESNETISLELLEGSYYRRKGETILQAEIENVEKSIKPTGPKTPEQIADDAFNAIVFGEDVPSWAETEGGSSVVSSSPQVEFNYDDEVEELIENWGSISEPFEKVVTSSEKINITETSWSEELIVSKVVNAPDSGNKILQGKQINKENFKGPEGSILNGNDQSNTLRGLAGWDILNAGGGDDLVHGGNGRDIIYGGDGSDELHGDFGWNTYKNQRDGSRDLIAIKSDEHLRNWWYLKSGNNPNGEKVDIIEELDEFDEIKILGVDNFGLRFKSHVEAKGLTGVGIYAGNALEALYVGNKLDFSDIVRITSGDASEAVMSNKLWSYNHGNEVPPLQQ